MESWGLGHDHVATPGWSNYQDTIAHYSLAGFRHDQCQGLLQAHNAITRWVMSAILVFNFESGLMFGCYPENFIDRGLAIGDFLRPAQAQAQHPLFVGLLAKFREIRLVIRILL